MANLGLITGIPYGPMSLSGVISKHGSKSNPSAQPGCGPNTKKRKGKKKNIR